MALDGIFLGCLKNELENRAVGMRVEKLHQPSREELLIVLRGRNGAEKLLLSARANSPRVHFTEYAPENPKTPPMLCMLFRKHLTNAMVMGVRQFENDRILFIDFIGTNEIGDKVNLTLCIEIMAQRSNVILIDQNGDIIDSLKRVDASKSSVRQILPGLHYELPPNQSKHNIFESDSAEIADIILSNKNKSISSAIMGTVQGVSPVVAREIAYSCAGDDIYCSMADNIVREKIISRLDYIKSRNFRPYLYKNADGKPTEFSFIKICQYGSIGECREYESFSALLDDFYYERDRLERIKQKSGDLYKMLQSAIVRISKKINLQKADLEKCGDRETIRIYAELITANQYALPKGASVYEVANYYDNNNIVKIDVDPALSPSANAQKYYKEYKKSKTAETMLIKLIEENEVELEYVESVLDALSRSETEAELGEIRYELTESGYIKNKNVNTKKKLKPIGFIEYESSDGFTILVGRNNMQNDMLTFKKARNNDMWLHTKDIHGSHVIIVSDNKEISDRAIEEASVIAAYHSKARESNQVPVNYTLIKNVKKPVGAKHGKVIYHVYYTLLANPDMDLIKKLKK